jgi:hypothetical protein
MIVILLLLFFGMGGLAQRPENASVCDYYAETLFGDSTNTTQAQLIESILALAFSGPFPNAKNISSDLTGIFNPGSFNGLPVDLRPWFNGTKASTNLNNAPVGIDWLDGGGVQPLQDFLTGKTDTVVITNTTNQ